MKFHLGVVIFTIPDTVENNLPGFYNFFIMSYCIYQIQSQSTLRLLINVRFVSNV